MTIYCCDNLVNINCDCIHAAMPEYRRDKAARFRTSLDKTLCIASYALLRYALYAEAGISRYADLNIAYSEFGKPYLADVHDLFFNISHCCFGVMCAVGNIEVGCDIQDIRDYSEAVAQRVFCENELQYLYSSADRDSEFAMLWSRKEAVLKYRGTGLHDNMRDIDTTVMHITSLATKHYCLSAYDGTTDNPIIKYIDCEELKKQTIPII